MRLYCTVGGYQSSGLVYLFSVINEAVLLWEVSKFLVLPFVLCHQWGCNSLGNQSSEFSYLNDEAILHWVLSSPTCSPSSMRLYCRRISKFWVILPVLRHQWGCTVGGYQSSELPYPTCYPSSMRLYCIGGSQSSELSYLFSFINEAVL